MGSIAPDGSDVKHQREAPWCKIPYDLLMADIHPSVLRTYGYCAMRAGGRGWFYDPSTKIARALGYEVRTLRAAFRYLEKHLYIRTRSQGQDGTRISILARTVPDDTPGSTDPGGGSTDPGGGSTDPGGGSTDPGGGSTDPGGADLQIRSLPIGSVDTTIDTQTIDTPPLDRSLTIPKSDCSLATGGGAGSLDQLRKAIATAIVSEHSGATPKTAAERKQWLAAVEQFVQAGCTADDIHRAYRKAREKWPNAHNATPMSIARHLSELLDRRSGARRTDARIEHVKAKRAGAPIPMPTIDDAPQAAPIDLEMPPIEQIVIPRSPEQIAREEADRAQAEARIAAMRAENEREEAERPMLARQGIFKRGHQAGCTCLAYCADARRAYLKSGGVIDRAPRIAAPPIPIADDAAIAAARDLILRGPRRRQDAQQEAAHA